MGSKQQVVYSVDSIAKTPFPESSITNVPEQRADFQAMQSAIAAQNTNINASKMSYLPKLNAFAEYQLNDHEAFGFGSNAYLVGAQLSWSLFKGLSVQNKINEQRIERDKMTAQLNNQKEQSNLEINKTLRQFQDAKFTLQQQDLAVEQAAEALRILQNRYQQGLVTTNDLLQAETLLSQQKLNQAQAIFQINTTIAYLQFLTSTSEK
jgi:outer membrane protein TolC